MANATLIPEKTRATIFKAGSGAIRSVALSLLGLAGRSSAAADIE
jgi:hypothetical protein